MDECVFLIGCRGVGKSSVGVELAQRLDYDFLDTDNLVVQKKGSSVAALVADEGWHEFRRVEQEVLRELQGRRRCVIATGGGAILHREIWLQLRKQGLVVWLTADLETLCDRLRGDQGADLLRPSLTGRDICQELSDVLAERNPLYLELADMVVDTGKLTVAAAVQVIAEKIGCS